MSYYCQTSDKSEKSLEKNGDLKYRETIIKTRQLTSVRNNSSCRGMESIPSRPPAVGLMGTQCRVDRTRISYGFVTFTETLQAAEKH